jgi:hypothetical protein
MNNPFSRLKHYLPDKIDPQENHATECLAACLVFSLQIRIEFIKFLSGEIKIDAASEVEVVTQQTVDGGGYIDLVLQQPGKFVVAIEVKVKSAENCSHHRQQLQNYKRWLGKESNGFLFTLVRDKDKSFSPEKHGANGRYTWRDLYVRFQQILKAGVWSDAEVSLIENFCDYLESEGIVTNYETKDLLNYAAGIKARKAVNGIFAQVAERLKKTDEKYETHIDDDRKGRWPQLKIRHPDWKKIFGEGENWKISLWFAVPGIWERKDEEQHHLYPEIQLLHIEHQNNWEDIKPKLPQWEKILTSKGFDWNVYQDNWNISKPISGSKIQSQPKRILASNGEKLVEKDLLASEDELIRRLVNWVEEYAAVIKSLGA